VDKTEDVLREGDKVRVKCIGIEEGGKIKLSLKETIREIGEDNIFISKVPR